MRIVELVLQKQIESLKELVLESKAAGANALLFRSMLDSVHSDTAKLKDAQSEVRRLKNEMNKAMKGVEDSEALWPSIPVTPFPLHMHEAVFYCK